METTPKPMHPSATWTDEQKKIVRAMTLEGKSAGEIGKLFGKSRNAVIGLKHRMGLGGLSEEARKATAKAAAFSLTARDRKLEKAERAKKAEATRIKSQAALLREERIQEILEAEAKADLTGCKPLWQRQSGECCYVSGTKAGVHYYCCKPVEEGKQYCEGHRAIMTSKPSVSQKKFERGELRLAGGM